VFVGFWNFLLRHHEEIELLILSIPQLIIIVPIMRLIKCIFCVKRTNKGGLKWFCPLICIQKLCCCGTKSKKKTKQKASSIDIGKDVLLVSGKESKKNVK
jgi:hypothetical protein